MAWKDLSMSQRAEVIGMAVKSGLRDMDSIRKFYDESIKGSRRFEDGGGMKITPRTTGGAGYIPPRDYTPITYTPQQRQEFDKAEKQIGDVLSWVPYVGTALDVDKAANDPSIGNTLWAGASVGLDLLSFGLLSGAVKRIRKAEKALEGAVSTTREAEKRYNTARKVFKQAPNDKNYRTLTKREREMWDAQSKTRKSGWGEAFDGSLQRELEQEKTRYNVYSILTGMGGAETNGLQLIFEGE